MTDTIDLNAIALTLCADRVRRAYLCASTETTRDYLCGVRVEPCKTGGATLTATNGHMLVSIRDADATLEGLPAYTGVTLSLAKDTLRALKDHNATHLTVEEGRATVRGLAANALHTQAASPFCESQGYPDWRRTVPRITAATAAPSAVAAFDQRLLSVLAEALCPWQTRPGEPRPLRVLATDEASPALVFGPLHDAFGVALPMRTYNMQDTLPEWLRATTRKPR
jgi:hypothetical protein